MLGGGGTGLKDYVKIIIWMLEGEVINLLMVETWTKCPEELAVSCPFFIQLVEDWKPSCTPGECVCLMLRCGLKGPLWGLVPGINYLCLVCELHCRPRRGEISALDATFIYEYPGLA